MNSGLFGSSGFHSPKALGSKVRVLLLVLGRLPELGEDSVGGMKRSCSCTAQCSLHPLCTLDLEPGFSAHRAKQARVAEPA